jgi:hypothetical protein
MLHTLTLLPTSSSFSSFSYSSFGYFIVIITVAAAAPPPSSQQYRLKYHYQIPPELAIQ